MNFATINFTAVLRNTCKGCICEHERMTVCKAMNERAAAHGLPDCDGSPDAQGHIFILSDGELFGMVKQQGEQESGATDSRSNKKSKGE